VANSCGLDFSSGSFLDLIQINLDHPRWTFGRQPLILTNCQPKSGSHRLLDVSFKKNAESLKDKIKVIKLIKIN